MDYKKAINVLTKMLKDNGSFSAEEKEGDSLQLTVNCKLYILYL
jgi:hypothetical protein